MNKGISHIIPTANIRELKTWVENRSIFHFDHCELNIFETRQQSSQVRLNFSDFVITAMIRGKKLMHLFGNAAFEYLPGEIVLVPGHEDMFIDFPDATMEEPTQCLALAVEEDLLKETLNLLNEKYPKAETGDQWMMDPDIFHLVAAPDLTGTLSRLALLSGEKEGSSRNLLAGLALRELLIRLMQTQARYLILDNSRQQATRHRFAHVMEYIKNNLSENINIDKLSSLACMSRPSFFRSFKREFGLSPVDLIIRERIKMAKTLLSQSNTSITEACYHSGFNNMSYFFRLFKKYEGITPKMFRNLLNGESPELLLPVN